MKRLAKIVTAFAIFGTVTALAAPDPTPTVPADATAPAAKPTVMSAAEMNVSAASLDAQIEDDGQQVQHLQEIAKKQKDVIKLNCVNDRLVQLKAQRNIADAMHAQLSAAIQKNSDDRGTLYQQFQAVVQSIRDLREQAKACIGEPELYKTDSGVTVDRPEVPDDPTVINPTVETVEPPGYASPYD